MRNASAQTACSGVKREYTFSVETQYADEACVRDGIMCPAFRALKVVLAVLFVTCLAVAQGSSVPPQEACKLAAKLQAATTSGWPVLLRYDVGSGHAGGRLLSRAIEDMAAEYAFLFSQLGMN